MERMVINLEQQFESCVDRLNFWLNDCSLDYKKTFFVYYVTPNHSMPKDASTKICVYVLESAKEDANYSGRIGYVMVDKYFFELSFEKQCDLLLEYLLVGLFVYFFAKVNYSDTYQSLIKFGLLDKKDNMQIIDISTKLISMAIDDITPKVFSKKETSYLISNTKEIGNLKKFFIDCINNSFNRKHSVFDSPLALARVKGIKNPSEDNKDKEKWLVSKKPKQDGKYNILTHSLQPIKKFEFHRFVLQQNVKDSQGSKYYIAPEIFHYRTTFYLVISNTKYNTYLQNIILLPTTSIRLNAQNGLEIADISLRETQESVSKQLKQDLNQELDVEDFLDDENQQESNTKSPNMSYGRETFSDKKKVYVAFNQPRSAARIRHSPMFSNDAILDVDKKKIQLKDELKNDLKKKLVNLFGLNKPSNIKNVDSKTMLDAEETSIPILHKDTFNISDSQQRTKNIDLALCYCKSGVLERGGNINNRDFGNYRDVKITKPFLMSQNLINVGFFLDVVNHFKLGAKDFVNYKKISSIVDKSLPITNISWLEAVRFCNLLSELNNLLPVYYISKVGDQSTCSIFVQNKGYRLPTEVEFEYAAKAGVNTTYINENTHIYNTQYSWFDNMNTNKSKLKLQPCGLKEPNAWNLYDMIGNAFVFCSDSFDTYLFKNESFCCQDDFFVCKSKTTNRVLKSAAYDTSVEFTHIQNRTYLDQNAFNEKTGFRVCRNFLV